MGYTRIAWAEANALYQAGGTVYLAPHFVKDWEVGQWAVARKREAPDPTMDFSDHALREARAKGMCLETYHGTALCPLGLDVAVFYRKECEHIEQVPNNGRCTNCGEQFVNKEGPDAEVV